jgi:hypothetical protein
MIDTTLETRCKNPSCGKPVHQIPGHRRRQYCNDTCKQTAYRLRKEQVHRGVTIVDESTAIKIAQLERDLAEANRLIEKLASKKTTTPLKKSYQERLQRWGEKLDWPALDIHIRIQPGRKNWRVFMINESNDQLIRAIIAAERVEEHKKNK